MPGLEVQMRLSPDDDLGPVPDIAHWQCPYCLFDTEDVGNFEVIAARTGKCPQCGESSDIRRLEWTACATPQAYAFFVYHSIRRKVKWDFIKEWLNANDVADEFWKEYKAIREQLRREKSMGTKRP